MWITRGAVVASVVLMLICDLESKPQSAGPDVDSIPVGDFLDILEGVTSATNKPTPAPAQPAVDTLPDKDKDFLDIIEGVNKPRPSPVPNTPTPATNPPVSSSDQCSEGHKWKQNCNDCFCRNGASFCTNRPCIPTTTGQITVIAPTGLDMWKAARDGNLAYVNNALDKGINPNWQNKDYLGSTALYIASQNNHPSIISALLNARADKEQGDNYNGITPLFIASSRGSTDSVSTLIERGADVNSQTNAGNTPLMEATGKGYLSIVEALIDAHAIVTLSNKAGATALHQAANYNRQELARVLLQNGADATKQEDTHGWTPSDAAREQGYHELANIINTITGRPTTAVHIKQPTTLIAYTGLDLWNAAKEGNLAYVNNALATNTHHLNWKNQGYFGNTALHIASENNHPAVVSALLDAGAEKDLQNDYGATPIFVASDRGSTDSITILINRGANVNIMTNGGYTPLMQATGKGFLSIVEALVGANANIYLSSKKGETALHGAASYNREVLARLLLQKGADPTKLDKEGRTPIDAARERGYHQLANIINAITSSTVG